MDIIFIINTIKEQIHAHTCYYYSVDCNLQEKNTEQTSWDKRLPSRLTK